MKNQEIHLSCKIPEQYNHLRLDAVLARLFPQYSRAQFQQWILQGFVKLEDKTVVIPRLKIKTPQTVRIEAILATKNHWLGQDLPLSLIYEDEAILVVNKPAGLVVHPGAGNPDHTLVNALLHYAPELNKVPRAGVVHRLDKDTSGLLVVARTLESHHALISAMQHQQIKREYLAIVQGVLTASSSIKTEMGRHPTMRTKMAVVAAGKKAITHYQILERFRRHTLLTVRLETGRTHQIRVHMAHIRHPIVGDTTYNLRRTSSGPFHFHRQALHAIRLSLTHPFTSEHFSWEAPIPEDINQLIKLLRDDLHDPS